jgi:mannose-6-phosphate isomerase-like protein (cupin superfamily)
MGTSLPFLLKKRAPRYTDLMFASDVFVRNAAATAQFSPEKMAKTTLVQGTQLFAGLNCFEPGQQHSLHSHAGQDKLYVVLEGMGLVRIGEREEIVTAGDIAFAADGVPHSVLNPGPGRLVMMAVLAPPPPK